MGSVGPGSASTCSSANSCRTSNIFAIHELCASFLVALHSLSSSYPAMWEACGPGSASTFIALQVALECPTSSPSTSSVLAFWWLCIHSLAATQQCGKRAGRALPRPAALQIAVECPTSSPSTSSVLAFWWLCIRSLVATQQCGKCAGRALPRLVALRHPIRRHPGAPYQLYGGSASALS